MKRQFTFGLQLVARVICVTAIFTHLTLSSSKAEPYQFFKIADSGSQMAPGEIVDAFFSHPVLDGDHLVFRARSQSSSTLATSIWSLNIRKLSDPNSLVKLVDRNTPVPGGTGTFVNLDAAVGGPSVRDGYVLFGGTDQGTNPAGGAPIGIYGTRVTGGAIQQISHYSLNAPGSSSNFLSLGQDSFPYGTISTAGGIAAFEGAFTGGNGIFVRDFLGGGISPIANSNFPANPGAPSPINQFYNPATNGTDFAFIGGNPEGVGLYVSHNPPALGSYTLIASQDTTLPGSTSPAGSTRFIAPSVQMDGNTIGFIAKDIANSRTGIYLISKNGGAITKVVDSGDSLDEISTISSELFSYSLRNGKVFFRARDAVTQRQAYYLWESGSISKILSNSGTLGGVQPIGLSFLLPESTDRSRIAFGFSAGTGPANIIALGIPNSQIADPSIGLNAAPSVGKTNQNLTYNLKIRNNSGARATNVSLKVDPSLPVKYVSERISIPSADPRQIALPDLEPGQEIQRKVVLLSGNAGTLETLFEVSSDSFDSQPGNEAIITTTPVLTPIQYLRFLANQGRSFLRVAKQEIPAGKKLTAKQKLKKSQIAAARKSMDLVIREIKGLYKTDAKVVAKSERAFTSKNIKSLTDALSKGKSAKLKAKQRASQWSKVNSWLVNFAK